LRVRLRELFGFEPREEQVEAITTLAIAQEDLILIARTGWGKSLIFQALPVLRGGICLMIMPLNLLEEDQVRCPSTPLSFPYHQFFIVPN
jgi:superfamily II DNA helicase RecQ